MHCAVAVTVPKGQGTIYAHDMRQLVSVVIQVAPGRLSRCCWFRRAAEVAIRNYVCSGLNYWFDRLFMAEPR